MRGFFPEKSGYESARCCASRSIPHLESGSQNRKAAIGMRTFALSGFIAASLGLGLVGTAKADFVNGSFETGTLAGWTIDAASAGDGLNPFGTTYGAGMDGKYWMWLAGFETDRTLSQTLTGLTAGTTYNVDFLMASEATHSDQLRVSVDGGPGTLFTAPPDHIGGAGNGFWNNWVSQEYSFTATGTTATVQFDSVGLNKAGYDVGLDNVRLSSAVPEPGSVILLLTMIAGLGLGTNRLRRS